MNQNIEDVFKQLKRRKINLKKTLKKISKILIVAILLLGIDLSLITNCVQAAEAGSKSVYQIDYCEKVLSYKGIPRGAAYVVYEREGVQYPAYCINPERIGVGETPSYNVDVNGYITDVMLWRIIINGYPYKTAGELGVANKKEAYLATKQAIYCYLDNRNVYEYSGIGEAGARTVKALRQIWEAAQSSTETKISNTVNIIANDTEWKQDNLNKNYISKTYKIEAPAPIVAYNVTINGQNLPNGLIIADTNNNIKDVFMPGEEFKILIPCSELNKSGSFEISVDTKMDTKPVFFGYSQNSNLQNYALTAFTYEDSSGIYYDQYYKNNSQIKILKQEKDTKKLLEGVEFRLLDSNKKAILQSLITDKNGEIVLENIIPGTYYLQEVKTLPGYVLYDENIQIDIGLNETVNVTVNNSKEKNIEVSKSETNIEVGKTEENIKEKNNEESIIQEKNETNISKETNSTNISEEKNQTNISSEINNKNTNKEINEINILEKTNETNIIETINQTNITKETNSTNIRKLPKTGM